MKKELTIQLETQLDGTIKPSIKETDEDFTTDEIYMMYKYLEIILNESKFDWSKEGFINKEVRRKEDLR